MNHHLHLFPHHLSLLKCIHPSWLLYQWNLGVKLQSMALCNITRPYLINNGLRSPIYTTHQLRARVRVCACKPTPCLSVMEESATLVDCLQASSRDLWNKEPVNQSLIDSYQEAANVCMYVCVCMCECLPDWLIQTFRYSAGPAGPAFSAVCQLWKWKTRSLWRSSGASRKEHWQRRRSQ